MGNAVGIECCPFEDVLSSSSRASPGEEGAQGQHGSALPPGTQPRFRSILWAWKYSLDARDDLCTTHQPLHFSQFSQFSDESAYVVLHLFLSPDIQAGLPPLEPLPDPTATEPPSLRCMELAVSFQQQLTPRGQASSFGGIHSVANSLQSADETKRASAVQYDIYLWHGRECPALVKANALAQAFDLDGRLKHVSLGDLVGMFVHGHSTTTSARFLLDAQDATDWQQHSKQSHLLTFLSRLYFPHIVPEKQTSTRNTTKRPHSRSTSKKSPITPLKNEPASLPSSPSSKSRVIIHRNRKSSHSKEKKSRSGTRTSSDQNTPAETDSPLKKSSSKSTKSKPPGKEPFTRLNMRSVSLPSHEIKRVSRLAQGLPGFQLDIGALATRSSSPDAIAPPESKAAKIARYNKICSQITDNLFIGSDLIAQSADILQAKGITHVLNCAGTVCPNYHPNKFTYLMLYLHDGPQEDISGLFYDVIEFMDDAIQQHDSS